MHRCPVADSRAPLVQLLSGYMTITTVAAHAKTAAFAALLIAGMSLVAAHAAPTNPRFEEIKRCLQDFDGILWKLAYQPRMEVHSCSTPDIMGNYPYRLQPGNRRLEILADLTLGADTVPIGGDESYAAIQTATFNHFDLLIRQRGYRLIASENGNARTTKSPHTRCMLQRAQIVDGAFKKTPCPDNDPQVELPPIPYISLARYVRQEGDRTYALTYKVEAGNMWSISIEGLPVRADAP